MAELNWTIGHMSDTELLPKSNAQAVRRLEVFTGTGRRRSWNAEEKERIVAESHTCGDSVSAVARRHGLTPQQLFSWRRHVRHSVEGEAGAPTFAPVIVDAGATGSCGAPVIEIVIGAATVRFVPGIDAAALATVLRAVKAAT
jgi:transposase